MKKQHYKTYSYLFFVFSIVFSIFFVNALSGEISLGNIISAVLFGVVVILQLRLALLMRRKANELNLE